MSFEDDEKLKMELNVYIELNKIYIDKLYESYLKIAKEIGLSKGWVWNNDQLAALMLVVEKDHYRFIERMELKMESAGFDPLANPKMVYRLISKTNKGVIVFVNFIKDGNIVMGLKKMSINEMDDMTKKNIL